MSKIDPHLSTNALVLYEGPVHKEHDLTAGIGMQKPDGWPAVMAWPPKRLKDGIKNGTVNSENAQRFQDYYDKYASLSVRQSQRVANIIREQSSRFEDLDKNWDSRLRLKAKFGYDETRHHNHVAWACLLDPNGDFRGGYDQYVSSYGFTTLSTVDGGKMRASESGLRVEKWSDNVPHILVEEALARGWDNISVRGDVKFVMHVVQAAKARGLAVDAKVTGLAGLMHRPIKVMDTLPIDKTAHEELNALFENANTSDEEKKKKRKDPMMIQDAGDGTEPRMS